MPSFHIIIGADLLLVHIPAGGRPGSALYPGAIEIVLKLLQGFSGGLQLKTLTLLVFYLEAGMQKMNINYQSTN